MFGVVCASDVREKPVFTRPVFMTQINLTPHITRRPPLVSSVQHEGNKQGSLREDVVVSVSYMTTRTLIYAGL